MLVSCSNTQTQPEKENIYNNTDDSLMITDSTIILNFNKISYENFVTIKFNQSINGYRVGIIWKPDMRIFDRFMGKAIIAFTNNKKETMYVVHNDFSLPYDCFIDSLHTKEELKLMVQDNTDEKIKSFAKGQLYHLDYKLSDTPQNDSLVHLEEKAPLFFADVNFDGKDELLLANYGLGQRSATCYDVYWFSSEGISICPIEPLQYLDVLSTINKKNKTISLYSSSGADNSEHTIYQKNKNGGFDLSLIEIHNKERYSKQDSTVDSRWRIETYKVKTEIKKTLIKTGFEYN